MRATGIVRRMDDLGRVVIPKELRRQLRLREGAPLEIFTPPLLPIRTTTALFSLTSSPWTIANHLTSGLPVSAS